jgi:hypothetical protein
MIRLKALSALVGVFFILVPAFLLSIELPSGFTLVLLAIRRFPKAAQVPLQHSAGAKVSRVASHHSHFTPHYVMLGIRVAEQHTGL